MSGLLLGGLQVSSLVTAAKQERDDAHQANWQGPNALDLSRLLAALDLQATLRIPAGHETAHGPWSALSDAHELLPSNYRVGWASVCLARIQPARWPQGLGGAISSRLVEMQEPSFLFAKKAPSS